MIFISCSLKCFKDEKHAHAEEPAVVQEKVAFEVGEAASLQAGPYDNILMDPMIQAMLRSRTLQHHLLSVRELYANQSASGEQTEEGRKDVALKKLRELRAGGVEDNIEVEEFVARFLELQHGKESMETI
ncbi:hypothetical protein V1514DRAFT_338868 [Lipomyces japonicus]|uniref:uncharacterized protein n=1 Tax=Lipomyces japonicus TaxID=56871 RepID=UPI0034CDDC62